MRLPLALLLLLIAAPALALAQSKFVPMDIAARFTAGPLSDPQPPSTLLPAGATPEHRAWMNANWGASYGFWQATQYPWTALGYTYDWCNPSTTVGVSEFIVRAGATVTVTGVYPHDAYCLP